MLGAACASCAPLLALAAPAGDAGPSPPAASASARPTLEPPRLLTPPDVAYPEGARGDAVVRLTVTVGDDGAVRDATPTASNEPFSSAARAAVLTFRFAPATRDGRPVSARIRFEITFREPTPEPSPEAAPPAPSGAEAPPPPPPPITQVDVRGERGEPSRSATLSRAEVRQIPGAFGDPFRALETLPGVTPIVSGFPFFYVRGAPPGNVGYFVDGVRVPYLFHVLIGPSVIHPGLIARVDLYPGGYPARFGRFAGGVVSGETVPPTPQAHGEFNVRLFDAGALAEAEVAETTVLVGGRYSYTAALLTQLSPDIELSYWDYQARVSRRLGRRDRVSTLWFGTSDYLGQKTPTQTLVLFGSEFHRGDVRWDHELDGGGELQLALALGHEQTSLAEGRFLRDRMAALRSGVTRALAPGLLLRAGSDVQLDAYDVQLSNGDEGASTRATASLFPRRTDLVTGARADVVWSVTPRLEATLGGRVDLYTSDGAAALGVDPRAALRVAVTDRLRLLSAMGVAHQPPSFVVPVPGFQPGGLRGGLQRALQQSVGIERELDAATTATLTAFHNTFFSMSDPLAVTEPRASGCAPGQFPTDSIGGDRGGQPTGNGASCGRDRFRPGTLGPDASGGGGQAVDSQGAQRRASAFEARTLGAAIGLELYLKRRMTSRLGGYLSYTLSRSTRSYGRTKRLSTFDRTHVANAALAYDLGRAWRAGTRVTFYTGLPKAPDVSDPSTRLPSFYRVDLRLEKRWQLAETAWISFVAEWMNATLRKEAITTSCTLDGCQAQMVGPITIPSLGVEGGF